ncbi:MAG: DUF2490 domain-containing protein [Bacteroidia bacterium]|nr:DUF2490 domain-containing protein [Bacteroidia bacterium]
MLFYFVGIATTLTSQNTRINDFNSIGWYNLFMTKKINDKWSIHLEYQWRRTNFITDWQQSLLRTGINYKVNQKLLLRVGYGWIETFPYGNIPLQAAGKVFTEHRAFQALLLNDNLNSLEIQHRLMLEQRWTGRYLKPNITSEDDFVFVNRMRYMLRLQIPLGKKQLEDQTFYAAIYDEIFIQFGENVQENIFDQNRLSGLIGYRANKYFKLEAGYLYQAVLLGREIKGNNVVQKNNGLIINAYLNF